MKFEDITQKVKKFGQNTVEEVQKLNEVRQLNGKITDAKKQIESTYLTIGKKLFDLYKESPAEGFETEINSINEKMEEIAQLQEQIRAVKGVAVCPCCHMEVSVTERFCSNCGTKMPEIFEIVDGDEDAVEVESEDVTGAGTETAAEEVKAEAETVTEEAEAEAEEAEAEAETVVEEAEAEAETVAEEAETEAETVVEEAEAAAEEAKAETVVEEAEAEAETVVEEAETVAEEAEIVAEEAEVAAEEAKAEVEEAGVAAEEAKAVAEETKAEAKESGAADKVVCPNCHAEVSASEHFCYSCGHKLQESSEAE